MKQSIAAEKSYAFALRMIRLARSLRLEREYDLARQLLRSATSIGANVEEALAGVSHADFVAKMSTASKEARETHYWLRLIRDSATELPDGLLTSIAAAEELIRILTAIVKTGQGRKSGIPKPTKH